MGLPDTVVEQIRGLPNRPGIYLFRDREESLLYVGKAKSLRKRVASYLRSTGEPRIDKMLREVAKLDFVLTDSESEALLLENNWIKSKQPRYNVLLRDDKTYPYVKLTMGDRYPRVAFTRRIRRDGGEYFGPYLPGGLARKAINLVQKLFEIRVCTIEIDGSLPRPCLYYDLNRCLGPCVKGLTSHPEYTEATRQARMFLGGKNDQLVRELKLEMRSASDDLAYERAAKLRDMVTQIEAISQRRKLTSVDGEDVDIFGVYSAGGNAALVVLVMRGGQVLDRREVFWEGRARVAPAAVLSEMLPQIYDRTTFLPKEVHLPMHVEGAVALESWLSQKRGDRVYLRYPARGPKSQRVELAMRNAALAYRRRFRVGPEELEAVTALADRLGLPEPPTRIEGIDISNFQGSEMVGSLVVWEGGRLKKSDYRSFNIRGLAQADDFAAIRQVVMRRYRRRLEELGSMPDLILIDGGRGQLNAAVEALTELGVEDTPILGLAKREEEVYLVSRPEPLRLDRRDPALKLLQQVRDEAHRFALSRHRRRRSRRSLSSVMDELRGVGPKRRKVLLRRFGSLEGLKAATLEEVQAAVGTSVGEDVYRQLHTSTGPGSSGPEGVESTR